MSDTHNPALVHHFETAKQQRDTATLGMWAFLVNEVLFFGGLFGVYVFYRMRYPEAWTEASHQLDPQLGGLNTAVLIVSSITVVMAVRAAQANKSKMAGHWVVLTMLLGMVFLGVKYVEYSHKFHHHLIPGYNFSFPGAYAGPAEIFFSLYFTMTGMHALHMVIGLGIMGWLAWHCYRGRFSAEYSTPVEISGLYWHFVDIVWIFLFPLLYLIGRHTG